MISSNNFEYDATEQKRATEIEESESNPNPLQLKLETINFKPESSRKKILVKLNETISHFNANTDLRTRYELFIDIFNLALEAIKKKNVSLSNSNGTDNQLSDLMTTLKQNIPDYIRDLYDSSWKWFSDSAKISKEINNDILIKAFDKLNASPLLVNFKPILTNYSQKIGKKRLTFAETNYLINCLQEIRIFLISPKALEKKSNKKEVLEDIEISEMKDVYTITTLIENIIQSKAVDPLIKRIFLNQSELSNKTIEFFNTTLNHNFLSMLTEKFNELSGKLASQGIIIDKKGGQIPVFVIEIDGKKFVLKHYEVYTGEEKEYRTNYLKLLKVRQKLGDNESIIGKTYFEKELYYTDQTIRSRFAITQHFPNALEDRVKNQKIFYHKQGTIELLQNDIIKTAIELVKTLIFLNSSNLIFTDLKTSNVRCDEEGIPHFPDTKWIQERLLGDVIPFVGYNATKAYLPPELINVIPDLEKPKLCNYKDWQKWALGLVLYEAFSNDGNPKFYINPQNSLFGCNSPSSNKHIMGKIAVTKENGKTIKEFAPKVIDSTQFKFNSVIFKNQKGALLKEIIESLLKKEPNERISLDVVLSKLQQALVTQNSPTEKHNPRKKPHLVYPPSSVYHPAKRKVSLNAIVDQPEEKKTAGKQPNGNR